jgi:uncharacterized protein
MKTLHPNKQSILLKTEAHVKNLLSGERSGHDWWHIHRVRKSAKWIAEKEKGADLFIVELGALLHDIADAKFNGGNEKAGTRASREWLESLHVETQTIGAVCHIVEHISYHGSNECNLMKSKEGLIVQDADRLDALGAIGIARAFAYGGFAGRELYNPNKKPMLNATRETYRKNTGPTLNHFYEKLLLLKNLMNTKTAKEIAGNRHKFMESFLKEFYLEWDGENEETGSVSKQTTKK